MKIFGSFTPEVAAILASGGVGVIPTDTIYGLAASLSSQEAIERIYMLKTRDLEKPVGTILINETSQLESFVFADELLRIKDVWPGPTSVILPVGDVFSYAHKGKRSLAFRIPAYPELRALAAEVGPLATTSANISGKNHSETLQEAISIFGDRVDFYVDGGDLSNRPPSKIIRLLPSGEVEVIRGDKNASK